MLQGICCTALKKVCRKLGIERWPNTSRGDGCSKTSSSLRETEDTPPTAPHTAHDDGAGQIFMTPQDLKIFGLRAPSPVNESMYASAEDQEKASALLAPREDEAVTCRDFTFEPEMEIFRTSQDTEWNDGVLSQLNILKLDPIYVVRLLQCHE